MNPERRAQWVAVSAAVVAVACLGAVVLLGGDPEDTTVEAVQLTVPAESTTTVAPAPTAPAGPPAVERRLSKLRTISGDITPKSIVTSGTGVATAQNMMYTHTVTAYDADGELVATIPDRVRLSDFGIDKEGEYQGAPVEAAFLHDGSAVYVSNYSMYGPGFREGSDECSPSDGVPPSYLYRIGTDDWEIDQVVPVGAVPKYVAVTPDDERVLTTNWCTWDLTVSSTSDGRELASIELGRYPRGIAVSPDGRTAYVAIMGDTKVAVVSLDDYSVTWLEGVGLGPRHLVLSPDGRWLYSTNNKGGTVSKVDTTTGEVVADVSTGSQPRSMDISTDGTALYVVNYGSDSMAKLATEDMRTLDEVPTGANPIGISYDDSTGRVWVASYAGTIDVYDEVA
ncbi:MAG: YncE family protein [Acidobacteria bacterium]|nr:YncE family protein [Acidobacteriota bacterium]